MGLVQALPRDAAVDFPRRARLLERELRPRWRLQILSVDLNLLRAIHPAQRETAYVVRLDVEDLRLSEPDGVDIGALVELLHAIHRRPVILVVPGCVGHETEMIRLDLALIVPFFQECVEPLPDQGLVP